MIMDVVGCIPMHMSMRSGSGGEGGARFHVKHGTIWEVRQRTGFMFDRMDMHPGVCSHAHYQPKRS